MKLKRISRKKDDLVCIYGVAKRLRILFKLRQSKLLPALGARAHVIKVVTGNILFLVKRERIDGDAVPEVGEIPRQNSDVCIFAVEIHDVVIKMQEL